MDMKTSPKDLLLVDELDSFGAELDEIRQQVLDDLGERDVQHIRRIMHTQTLSEIAGRGLIHFSLGPISWAADSWRKTHNYEHHTYTNILGKDRDYGYAVLRLTDDVPWRPWHAVQFIQYGMLSSLFEWGVGLHELEFDRLKSGEVPLKEKIPFLKEFAQKAGKQLTKDYVVFPLLAGPFAPKVFVGNAAANLSRNLWASTIIFCGHFTEGARTFREDECENETRGQWYYRQLLGSSNFTGGKWLHIMSGHLSYQIEHHLFPDLPSHRYPEISTKVQAICERYDIPYNTGPFGKQFKTVLKRVAKFSFPKSVRQLVGAQ